jgi:hypothetical protein
MKYFSKEYLELIKKMSNSSLSPEEIEERIVDPNRYRDKVSEGEVEARPTSGEGLMLICTLTNTDRVPDKGHSATPVVR